MGKTVPSYRMALEDEIARWKPFIKALQTADEREAFEEMMDSCRNNAMARGAACNPIILEPMVMSIFLAQTKKLHELKFKLNDATLQKICAQGSSQTMENKR